MKTLIWKICIILLISKRIEGFIGVNWGRKSSQTLPASTVVELLMQNDLKDARIFGGSNIIAQAFANSDITLSISMLDDQLNEMTTNNNASNRILRKVSRFTQKNITLRYVILGENHYSNANGTLRKAVDILGMLSNAVQSAGHSNIKVTIPISTELLKPVKKPSDGEFVDEIKDLMIQTVQILQKYNAPFMLDFNPIYTIKMMNVDPEFAFMSNQSNFTISDNGTVYRNMFEFWYDACIWALRKVGAPDLKIVVGQIGWPTDGYPGANTNNARRFYKSFIRHITEGRGTPLRSGPIDVFLQSLIDENRANITHGPYQRHLGIYTFDGTPKLFLDLKGQTRAKIPRRSAFGADHMPSRWCVYNARNDNSSNPPDYLNKLVDRLCEKSDCSSLGYGGMCNNLNATMNISYAFNMYYQMKGQKEYDCKYKGLASIIVHDPSVDKCKFPVAILSADLVDRASQASSIKFSTTSTFFFTLLIIIIVILV